MSVQILLRIDKKENIENIYENKEIMFSCAANWIDYAIKQSDYKIGDLTEGVFARVKYPLTSTIRDKKNKPIGNNLLISCIEGTNDCFLRYIPVITTPVLCFFFIRYKKRVYKI